MPQDEWQRTEEPVYLLSRPRRAVGRRHAPKTTDSPKTFFIQKLTVLIAEISAANRGKQKK